MIPRVEPLDLDPEVVIEDLAPYAARIAYLTTQTLERQADLGRRTLLIGGHPVGRLEYNAWRESIKANIEAMRLEKRDIKDAIQQARMLTRSRTQDDRSGPGPDGWTEERIGRFAAGSSLVTANLLARLAKFAEVLQLDEDSADMIGCAVDAVTELQEWVNRIGAQYAHLVIPT